MRQFLIALAIVAAGAAGYLALSRPGLVRDVGREARALLPAPQGAAVFYRWRDDQGGVHIADTPPPPGTPYETVEADGEANLVPREYFTGRTGD